MAAWIQEERGQESWYLPADEDGEDRRPYWEIKSCPCRELEHGRCTTASWKKASVHSYISEAKVKAYLKWHLMYSDHHSLSGEVAERMARCANVTQRMETASERKAYRDSVDTAKQERSLAAQAKQKASDPAKRACSPSSPTNAKKRRTTSIDKPAIGAPLSSASSSSRASAAADEECLVMSGAELQKVYRSLARADWTVASTRNLMDRMAHVMANEKESINHAKITIHNILKGMGLPPALLDSDLQ